MGFFSKIKQNLNHGGVKIDFESPNTISLNDKYCDLKVHITSDSLQKINKITAELIRDPAGNNQTTEQRQRVTAIEQKEPFEINAGESKDIDIKLPINLSSAFDNQPEVPKAVASAIGKVGNVIEALDSHQYAYYLVVSADVDGISIDPSKQHTIQVLKPGEVGASIRLGS